MSRFASLFLFLRPTYTPVKVAALFWDKWMLTGNQKITIREAKRANAAYRPHGLRALGEISLARQVDFMPQALEIVPGVLEEFDDRMDIDSGNGLDPSDTLAAGVQCLLQCLNPATAGSGEGK